MSSLQRPPQITRCQKKEQRKEKSVSVTHEQARAEIDFKAISNQI